jgi:hypothetical protein
VDGRDSTINAVMTEVLIAYTATEAEVNAALTAFLSPELQALALSDAPISRGCRWAARRTNRSA